MINNINLTGMTDWTLTSLDSYIVGLSMVTTKSQFGWRCYSVEKVGLYAVWSVQGLCFLPSCHPLVSWCLGWRGTVFQGMGVWSQLCPMSFALLLWLNCWRCWVADEESHLRYFPLQITLMPFALSSQAASLSWSYCFACYLATKKNAFKSFSYITGQSGGWLSCFPYCSCNWIESSLINSLINSHIP